MARKARSLAEFEADKTVYQPQQQELKTMSETNTEIAAAFNDLLDALRGAIATGTSSEIRAALAVMESVEKIQDHYLNGKPASTGAKRGRKPKARPDDFEEAA